MIGRVIGTPTAPVTLLLARYDAVEPDWEESLNTTVSLLRTEAGCAPHDSELTGLIGELVTRSEEFRTAWAKHNVPERHPDVTPDGSSVPVLQPLYYKECDQPANRPTRGSSKLDYLFASFSAAWSGCTIGSNTANPSDHQPLWGTVTLPAR